VVLTNKNGCVTITQTNVLINQLTHPRESPEGGVLSWLISTVVCVTVVSPFSLLEPMRARCTRTFEKSDFKSFTSSEISCGVTGTRKDRRKVNLCLRV
jgi:hypothetical protein